MAVPPRLAHCVFRTNQLAQMVDWYCKLLGARVNYSSDSIAFLTNDTEHHRIALVALEPYAAKAPGVTVGFYHAAFAYADLGELLHGYVELRAQGVAPYRCINHGPTVSFYYRDPDGNEIEMQVDAFPDAASVNAFMRSEAFARNPIGTPVVPDELIAQRAAGVPDSVLLRRADTA
jgi:catechol-2,3-dioxygenase